MASEFQTLTEFCRWLCLWALPTFLIAGLAAWLVNLPAARVERARFFLDALSLGVRAGHSPERALVEISSTRDAALGARFHILAERIRRGLRLNDALDCMPGFIAPSIAGVLRAGIESGNLPAAIAAARRSTILPDAQIRAGLSCQILILFILNPLILAMLPYFVVAVFPQLEAILSAYKAKTPWAMTFISEHTGLIFLTQAVSIVGLYGAALFYVGGNRFTRWLEAGIFPVSAWLALRIPWKRKRVFSVFSTAFALLLDAGVAEERALQRAANATANEIFRERAARAIVELKSGAALTNALDILDPPREFTWRLANALRRKGRFADALEGWLVSLDAEANAQEQSAADTLTTMLVVANGIVIALVIGAVMQAVYSFSLVAVQ